MVSVAVKQQEQVIQREAEAETAGEEMVAVCPKCKTLETLWFTPGGLIQTRKFYQDHGKVYHDCGANQPCRLYRTWGKVSLD